VPRRGRRPPRPALHPAAQLYARAATAFARLVLWALKNAREAAWLGGEMGRWKELAPEVPLEELAPEVPPVLDEALPGAPPPPEDEEVALVELLSTATVCPHPQAPARTMKQARRRRTTQGGYTSPAARGGVGRIMVIFTLDGKLVGLARHGRQECRRGRS
jgi:hypothetical protein